MTPPYSEQAEQAVLGAMMLSPRAALDVVDVVREDDFFSTQHRMIYRAIVGLMATGSAHDAVTVIGALANVEEAGGLGYVARLCDDVPGAANGRHYAEIVHRDSQYRAVIACGADLMQMGYQPKGLAASDLIEQAEGRLSDARESGGRAKSQAEGYDALVPMVEREIESAKDGQAMRGLSSGLVDLDAMTNGFHEGDLIVVAARPGMGKTILGLNFSENVAVREKKPVLLFSMEMSKKELVRRSIANVCGIPLDTLRTGKLSEDEWSRYAASGGVLRAMPLHIDDTPSLTPLEVRARARRHQMKHGLGLIVVDYIGLMQTPGRDTRTNEIAEISRRLKSLAKELKVPVVALSQLNRKVEDRENKRPRMADIRDSGGVEQDADLILFPYRDEVYNETSKDAGTVEIIVGKQRNGPIGMVRAAFSGQYCRICNLAPGWRPTHEEPQAQRGFKREPVKHYQDAA